MIMRMLVAGGVVLVAKSSVGLLGLQYRYDSVRIISTYRMIWYLLKKFAFSAFGN